jgi:two-component system, NarL family, invasion response regulator UvrY
MLSTPSRVKLAIVDDHNLFRKGLIKLINLGDKHNKYVILFESENGIDLKQKLSVKNKPDIILMDIDMPDMDGYEAVSWLKNFYPDIKILVISMIAFPQAIERMTQLGVNGYLSKDIEVEDMHRALEALENNKPFFSENISAIMTQSATSKQPESGISEKKWNSLSENERRFSKLACTDLTYKEIAVKMGLSPKTIDGYREELFKKLQVRSRVALAISVIKSGFVQA